MRAYTCFYQGRGEVLQHSDEGLLFHFFPAQNATQDPGFRAKRVQGSGCRIGFRVCPQGWTSNLGKLPREPALKSQKSVSFEVSYGRSLQHEQRWVWGLGSRVLLENILSNIRLNIQHRGLSLFWRKCP